ncbi:MAG: hypothetical protein ACI4MN_05700 [Candidatus Coproplasma sp.]
MKDKKVKKYNFSRKPKRASKLWMWITRTFVITYRMRGVKAEIKKVNMEGLKPPYILLATHASEMDFCLEYLSVLPYKRVNNVVAIYGIRDMGDWLMRSVGSIAKRQFVRDFDLIRNLIYCVKEYGDIVCMYPEAMFSLDGCASYIPPSVGKMCKLLGIPVVVLNMQGSFIISPQWNKTRQPCPQRATITQIVNAEEIKTLSADVINERILKAFERDDFKYQYDNKIENNYKNRAHGLHSILYQCPHCKKEFEMYSEGTRLWCNSCGKGWQMTNLGRLEAEEGETEFPHIPDWFNWEKANVREEVRSGKYHYEGEVEVHTLPNAKKFEHHGKGKLTHTIDGAVLDATVYGEPVHLEWKSAGLYSVHIEYDFPFFKKWYKRDLFLGDCVNLSTKDDSFWLHPSTERDQITKISLATIEIHALALENLKKKD